jgi:hypothetical protein
MTRDEILAMESSRELDALVAEKVMGVEVVKGWIDWGRKGPIKRYSTDISVAWEIVERKEFMPLKLYKCWDKSGTDRGLGWCVNWCIDGECLCNTPASGNMECPEGNEVWAKTAPEAICKAALLAMEEN